MDLSGFVFNDEADNRRVNLICEGEYKLIEKFIKVIDVHEGGISVDNLIKFEIDSSFKLPQKFTRLQTDELRDIGRKLDKGNTFLNYLKEGQDKLVEGQDKLVEGQDKLVEGQDKLVEGQDKLVEGQDKLVEGQNALVKGQNEHTALLKDIKEGQDKGFKEIVKILEKIANKL